MSKKIIDQITVSIVFLFLLSLYRFSLDFSLILLWLGGLLGTVILESDYLFQVFLIQPELPLAQEIKRTVGEVGVVGGIKEVYRRAAEIKNLTFHTVFFQIIFYLFAFFMMTSTGSLFGQGLVLTALLSLLSAQVREVREVGELGKGWFYRLNVSWSAKQQKIYLVVAGAAFLVLSSFVSK